MPLSLLVVVRFRRMQLPVTVNTKPTTPILKMETEKQCEGESATLKIIEPVNYPDNESLRFNWYTDWSKYTD